MEPWARVAPPEICPSSVCTLQKGTRGHHHLSRLGVADDLFPVQLVRLIRGRYTYAPSPDSVAMDRMCIGNRETPKLLPGIEPLSPYELTVASHDGHFIGGLSDVIRSIGQNIQPPDFSGIHQITQPRITVVPKPITVPVHEDSHGVGMIEMHPLARQDTLKVAKHDGILAAGPSATGVPHNPECPARE